MDNLVPNKIHLFLKTCIMLMILLKKFKHYSIAQFDKIMSRTLSDERLHVLLNVLTIIDIDDYAKDVGPGAV